MFDFSTVCFFRYVMARCQSTSLRETTAPSYKERGWSLSAASFTAHWLSHVSQQERARHVRLNHVPHIPSDPTTFPLWVSSSFSSGSVGLTLFHTMRIILYDFWHSVFTFCAVLPLYSKCTLFFLIAPFQSSFISSTMDSPWPIRALHWCSHLKCAFSLYSESKVFWDMSHCVAMFRSAFSGYQ